MQYQDWNLEVLGCVCFIFFPDSDPLFNLFLLYKINAIFKNVQNQRSRREFVIF